MSKNGQFAPENHFFTAHMKFWQFKDGFSSDTINSFLRKNLYFWPKWPFSLHTAKKRSQNRLPKNSFFLRIHPKIIFCRSAHNLHLLLLELIRNRINEKESNRRKNRKKNRRKSKNWSETKNFLEYPSGKILDKIFSIKRSRLETTTWWERTSPKRGIHTNKVRIFKGRGSAGWQQRHHTS